MVLIVGKAVGKAVITMKRACGEAARAQGRRWPGEVQ